MSLARLESEWCSKEMRSIAASTLELSSSTPRLVELPVVGLQLVAQLAHLFVVMARQRLAEESLQRRP